MKSALFLAGLVANAMAKGDNKQKFAGLMDVVNGFKTKMNTEHAKTVDALEKSISDASSTISNKEAEQMNQQSKMETAIAGAEKFSSMAALLQEQAAQHDHDHDVAVGDEGAARSVSAIDKAKFSKFSSDLTEAITQGKAAQEQLCGATDKQTNNSEGLNQLCQLISTLLQDFNSQLSKAEGNWQSNLNAFKLMISELKNEQSTDKKGSADKTAESASDSATAGEFRQEATTSKAALASIADVLETSRATLKSKQEELKAVNAKHTKTMSAIAQFVAILEEGNVGSAHQKIGVSGSGVPGTSLLQTSVTSSTKARLVSLLAKRGLTQFAQQVAATGPFDEITNMIRQFIAKLESEVNDHMDKNAHCTKDLSDNEQSRNKNSKAVQQRRNKYAELNAKIVQTQEATAANAEQMSTNAETLKTATENRQQEKAAYASALDEYTTARDALKAGNAKLISMEVTRADAPAVFDFIDVLLTDFHTSISNVETAEKNSKSEFEDLSEKMAAEEVSLTKENENNAMVIQEKTQKLVATEKEFKTFRESLRADLEIFEGLRQRCLSSGMSFKDREAKRQEEIKSLNEALEVLKNAFNGNDDAAAPAGKADGTFQDSANE